MKYLLLVLLISAMCYPAHAGIVDWDRDGWIIAHSIDLVLLADGSVQKMCCETLHPVMVEIPGGQWPVPLKSMMYWYYFEIITKSGEFWVYYSDVGWVLEGYLTRQTW